MPDANIVSLFAETNNYISQNNEQNATFEEQDLINLIKNFDEIGQELMQINFSSDELNNEITTVLNNFGIVGENAIEKVEKMKLIYEKISNLDVTNEELVLTEDESCMLKYLTQLEKIMNK